jgi:hypothetical protein
MQTWLTLVFPPLIPRLPSSWGHVRSWVTFVMEFGLSLFSVTLKLWAPWICPLWWTMRNFSAVPHIQTSPLGSLYASSWLLDGLGQGTNVVGQGCPDLGELCQADFLLPKLLYEHAQGWMQAPLYKWAPFSWTKSLKVKYRLFEGGMHSHRPYGCVWGPPGIFGSWFRE